MLRNNVVDQKFAATASASHHKSAGLNAIGNNRMFLAASNALDPFNPDYIGSRAPDQDPKRPEKRS